MDNPDEAYALVPWDWFCQIVGKWWPSENFLPTPSLPPTPCVITPFWELRLRLDAASLMSGDPFFEPAWLGKWGNNDPLKLGFCVEMIHDYLSNIDVMIKCSVNATT